MFTLILPEGEVQTREGQNHEILIVSNRDKYSLQLTPKVKGNWERRNRGKNRSQRENERERNKSGCEEKEDNKKKMNGEAKREWEDEVILEQNMKYGKSEGKPRH